MAVTFNPNVSQNKYVSFGSKQPELVKFGPIDRNLTSDEIFIKRTKKAIFESSFLVLGACMLYFKAKKHFILQGRIEKEVKQYEILRRRREAMIPV